MSPVRTSLSREKPSFSGISCRLSFRLPRESGGPAAFAAQEEKRDSRLRGNDERERASSEQAVEEPIGSAAAAVAGEALAIDPVAPAGRILDFVIVAQPGGRRLSPPFGRDPLRP